MILLTMVDIHFHDGGNHVVMPVMVNHDYHEKITAVKKML